MRKRLFLVALLGTAVSATGLLDARQSPQQQQTQSQTAGSTQGQPTRDTSATPTATAVIAGRVVAADSGQPVKRARVIVSAAGRGGRSILTDEQGQYVVPNLASGTYTINASKAGFVNGSYGQRHPLQPGTPLDIADGQQATNIDVILVHGGVVTGRVTDEDGTPLVRARVTVQRYQYVNGARQLTIAGTDQSDDRGQYRVFGLAPGDYIVDANAVDPGLGGGLAGLIANVAGRGGRGGGPLGFGAPPDSEPTGYAVTYYPGVMDATMAGKVTVGPAQEVSGVDFQVQLVPLVTVRGIVGGSDNSAAVMLVPEDANGQPEPGATVLRGRGQQGGGFVVSNVPPGRFLAVARSGGRQDDPKTGMQAIVVSGQDIDNLAIVLAPGVSISGNITVESAGTPAPTDYSTFRIQVPEVNPLPFANGGFVGGGRGGRGGTGNGRANQNGSFEVDNLLPDSHYITVTGPGPWVLKSVALDGRDITDQPFDLKSGQNAGSLAIVLTDRTTSVDGTVRDGSGNGVGGLTVIAFSTDPQYWRSQSREIQAVDTDTTGAYHLRGLPPGDYQVIALDNVDPGQWYDPSFLNQQRGAAKPLKLVDGDKQTLDLPAPPVTQ